LSCIGRTAGSRTSFSRRPFHMPLMIRIIDQSPATGRPAQK
jgi:hypothetical protein